MELSVRLGVVEGVWTAAQARLRRVMVSEVMWWRRGEQRWTISSRALASRMVHVRVGNWDPYCAMGRYRRWRGSEMWWPRTRRMAETAWVSSARHFSRVYGMARELKEQMERTRWW
jgi:hypothetical protein